MLLESSTTRSPQKPRTKVIMSPSVLPQYLIVEERVLVRRTLKRSRHIGRNAGVHKRTAARLDLADRDRAERHVQPRLLGIVVDGDYVRPELRHQYRPLIFV